VAALAFLILGADAKRNVEFIVEDVFRKSVRLMEVTSAGNAGGICGPLHAPRLQFISLKKSRLRLQWYTHVLVAIFER